MPLIVVKKQTTNNRQEELLPVEQEKTHVESVNKPLHERAIVQRRNPSDPVLIVNGKEKKIGKKSQYLLDMLIIEE
jgi:hypothetical protein